MAEALSVFHPDLGMRAVDCRNQVALVGIGSLPGLRTQVASLPAVQRWRGVSAVELVRPATACCGQGAMQWRAGRRGLPARKRVGLPHSCCAPARLRHDHYKAPGLQACATAPSRPGASGGWR